VAGRGSQRAAGSVGKRVAIAVSRGSFRRGWRRVVDSGCCPLFVQTHGSGEVEAG